MSHWKLGIYGHPLDDTKEESMDYYFVVVNESNLIESVVHRSIGSTPARVAGKRFVKATGVQLAFFYKLQAKKTHVDIDEVMAYVV